MTYTPTGDSDQYLSPEELDAQQQELINESQLANEVQSIDDQIPVEETGETDSNTFQDRRDSRRGSNADEDKQNAVKDFIVPDYEAGETFSDTPLYEVMNAPAQGVVNTMTDTFNFFTHSARKGFNIPEVPKVGPYESNVANAIRDISGLVIPSMGFKSMLVKGATKLQAAKFGPKWLQRLGNKKSFQWFSKFGADVGTSTAVDYVAEQNQTDDNLVATLKDFWPRTYQFIPDVWATGDSDTADIKRSKNVNEGAVFGTLGHIVEGVAMLAKAGRSTRKATFLAADVGNQKRLEELTKDEFTDIVFSDNPIEDSIMRNTARREKELDNLGTYLKVTNPDSKEPLLGVHDVFDVKETGLISKSPDGVLGAAADAAQIANNVKSSYGRLGNVISNAALKYGLDITNRTDEVIIRDLAAQIKAGGKYSKKLGTGEVLTQKQIAEAGERLTEVLIDPRMQPGDMYKLLDEFKISLTDGNKIIDDVAYAGVMGAMSDYYKQILDMDMLKAKAYLTTSLAGQISDIAEGARLMDDSLVVNQAIDQIADRVEYLMVEKGLNAAFSGRTLRNKRLWETAKSSKKAAKALNDNALVEHRNLIEELVPNAKNWSQTMRRVAKENPDFLKPLMMANEFADGNIDSLYKMNKVAMNKFSTLSKAFIDANPDMPSLVNKQFMSTIFNSTLSALATPIRALTGNAGGLTSNFVSPMVGSLMSGDLATMKRVMWGHHSMGDTLNRAYKHMGLVYRKAATDPTKLSYVMREDIRLKIADDLEWLTSYAQAAQKNGEDGPMAILNLYETLTDIAQDPNLRFGVNAMTALDGFSRSTLGSIEARYTAFDNMLKNGDEITEAGIKKASDDIYKTYFDENGMITNKAVEWANSEIALNLDSEWVDGFGALINRFPIARTHFMFPRTAVNVIDIFSKYSPGGIFAREYQQLWGPVGLVPGLGKKFEDFDIEEIAEVLSRHGQTMDGNFKAKFETIRMTAKGRVALGTFSTMGALKLFREGAITGNGHYDKSRQRSRVKLGWKPKTVKVPGTNLEASYEFLGPIGDWLAFTVDVADNFDLASTAWTEQMFQKLSFVFSASMINKSVLSNVEPLNDILQGDVKALNRWGASMGNNLFPLGGFRNEIGRVMNPALRDIKGEMIDNWRNRNNWLDAFDPNRSLPELYDPIDGGKVGFPENYWTRAWNAYAPIKVSERISPEKQWLIDAEYNYSPQVATSTGGAELENSERSALSGKIGEQAIFNKELKKIIKDAQKITYRGREYPFLKGKVGFIEILKTARQYGVSAEDLEISDFAQIYSRLDRAFVKAKKIAESSLDPKILAGIKAREIKKEEIKQAAKSGDIDGVLKIANE